ncbi:MAG: hypothetical protein FJ207_09360 [Gemmatimonadetes bacterium]|nr:hypothetical protein [Gemmatimonadota bacterium]
MLRPSPLLDDFETTYARERTAARTPEEAMAIVAALWNEAVALNPDFPSDWREDLEADLAIARAINGLPPKP